MFKLNKKYSISTATISLLLVLLLPSTNAIRIPSRFFYENAPQSAALQIDNETTQDETNSSSTNLSLLGDGNGHKEIPLEFYSKLDDVDETEEFIDLFVPKDTNDPQLGILGKNMKRNVERAAAVIPRPAACIPENMTVPLTPLNPSKDPKIFYYPKCTRVQRCGGCCNSDLMSCQPTDMEYINFSIIRYRYGVKKPVEEGKEIVVVEKHNRCRCQCRIKEEHCNSYQEYHPELCRCICTNEDAKEKCLSQDHKIWDEQACRCICRDTQYCTTGTLFDESQCKCIDPFNKRAGPSLEDRRRFIIKAVAVDPNNSTIYDSA